MACEDTNEDMEQGGEVSVYSPKERIVRLWDVFISITCLAAVTVCVCMRCLEDSWAGNAGFNSNQTNFYHYVHTAYWATVTMASGGYGDIQPSMSLKQILCVFVGLTGILIFNYTIISQITATISGENAKSNASLHATAQPHYIPTKQSDGIYDTSVVKIPVLFLQLPYFREAGQSFLQDLASVSAMYFFPKEEIIQYSNTITRELFCIRRGTCQILTDDLSDIVGRHHEGMYFGEAGFLFGQPALLTVRAMTCCEILSIDFDKVRVILERYPVLKRQIKQLQANSKYRQAVSMAVEKKMKRQSKITKECSAVEKKKKVLLTFQGRRYCKKSRCCEQF